MSLPSLTFLWVLGSRTPLLYGEFVCCVHFCHVALRCSADMEHFAVIAAKCLFTFFKETVPQCISLTLDDVMTITKLVCTSFSMQGQEFILRFL